MEKIKITVNGKEIEARPDQTILEAVHENGIDRIPTLCHDPKLPPYGSCYLCVVEVEKVAKLIPSCSSPVAPGMVIHTDNERIRKARKTALELLLSNHYADCLGPCTLTCPAGVDVQGYIALMAEGKHREAVRLIKETNPLPLVCGRVCVRECEVACRRNRVDDKVGIDYLKRYATDIDIEAPWTPAVPPKNGKKIAVVGGGPAGLTCAYYLILKGYAVTLIERAPHLGGMLRYGIPEYRLPKKLLDREIDEIIKLGVEVKRNTLLGRDVSLADLKKDFDAVFLAFGAQKAKLMRLADEEKTAGVLPGIDFLWQLQTEKKPEIFGKVVVVGGGNTAIDAARTARRLGADKVTILYRRTKHEMPAHEMEIEAALEEGVELIELSAPTRILSQDGRLQALECIRMELGEPDQSGRRSPVPMAGSEYRLECDFAVSAIGQDVDLCGLPKSDSLKTTKYNTPIFDEVTLETSIPGVFSGGDMASGPSVAIAAIAQGKIAANAIDHFLQNGKAEGKKSEFVSRKDTFGEIPDVEFSQQPKIPKEKMPELPPSERIKNFDEVETGFSSQQTAHETERCLECGCSAFFTCDLRKYAGEFQIDIQKFLGEVKKYKVDRHHPFITLDPNKCIACGRCVRTCSEVLKVSALGFVYRGFKAVVKPSMEKHLLETACISCGNCIAACPTGAISEKYPFRKPGPWKSEGHPSVCSFCSVGCQMQYDLYTSDLFTVGNVDGGSHNKGYLCSKGRFGYRYHLDNERLTRPLIRRKDRLEKVDWPEAIDFAASRLAKHAGESGGKIAVTASPRLKNEELYLLQRWARSNLQTNHIGSFSRLLGDSDEQTLLEMLGFSASTATFDELPEADLILVLNGNLTEDNLVAELKIKDAQKRGARLAVFHSYESSLVKFADLWIDSKRGSGGILLAAVASALIESGKYDKSYVSERTTGFDRFKKSLAGVKLEKIAEESGIKIEKLQELIRWFADPQKKIAVVYSLDFNWEKSPQDLQAALSLLLMTGRMGKKGNGIILLSNFANTQGLFDMGMDSRLLPGQIAISDPQGIDRIGKQWKTDLRGLFTPSSMLDGLISGTVKALIAWGEDPLSNPANLKLFDRLEFLLVADHFLTPTAKEADLVLPLSTPLETSGSFTSADRRIQQVPTIFPPAGGMETISILLRLAEKMGTPLSFSSMDDIAKEIHEAIPFYRQMKKGGIWSIDPLWKHLPTPDGKGRFFPLTLEIMPNNRINPVLLASENYYLNHIRNKLVI